jgi:hypothetical protein
MTRLETVRTYFIERITRSILADARLINIRQPAELFDAGDNITLTPDEAGFKRIPTPPNLKQRIDRARDPKERQELSTFLEILRDAINQMTAGLGTLDTGRVKFITERFAPAIRQHISHTFFPVSVGDFLNFNDGTLRATYHDQVSTAPLPGRIFELMFENPTIPQTTNLPDSPYRARVPFVSTVGVEPAIAPYPASPLSRGRLNLGAADPRFAPNRMQPTLYAEIKAIKGAIEVNRSYDAAAAQGGRFAPLRGNRIHKDPLINLEEVLPERLPRPPVLIPPRFAPERDRPDELGPLPAELLPRLISTLHLTRLDNEQVVRRIWAITQPRDNNQEVPEGIPDEQIFSGDPGRVAKDDRPGLIPYIPYGSPLMVIYHGFYSVDDEARKTAYISATNREGHHLATGILFSPRGTRARFALMPTHVFTCRGPDNIRVIPFDHPSLQRINDRGEPDPNGNHIVVYSQWGSPLEWNWEDLISPVGDALVKAVEEVSGAIGANKDYAAALGTLAGIAAVAALSGNAPVALAALFLFVVVLLVCIFSGCDDRDRKGGGNGLDDAPSRFRGSLTADPEYQDAASHISPPGTTAPGRHFILELIPHLIDRNLYGLHGDGMGTFQMVEDPKLKEMLGWVAFPGGFGYQLWREMPGKQDTAGSSWRNYFDLFTRKLLDIELAQRQVRYFGA